MNSRKRSKPTTIEERAKLVSWRDKVEIVDYSGKNLF